MSNTNIIPEFNKEFFETHEVPKYSAANIFYFSADDMIPDLFDRFDEICKEKGMKVPNRYPEIAEITALSDPIAIVNYMRTLKAMPNREALVRKIKEYAETTMPLIIKRYLSSGLDEFIEIAAMSFIKNDVKYLHELKKCYPNIRSPYAKAVVCLVFAMQDIETDGEFLYQEYQKFQRMYPKEDYADFPLLGLHIIYNSDDM